MESRSKQHFMNKIEFFFCLKLFFFVFEFFLYTDIKNNFLKIKKYIILIYFQIKITLKNNIITFSTTDY
jgi:hypothetical protein